MWILFALMMFAAGAWLLCRTGIDYGARRLSALWEYRRTGIYRYR